MLKNIAIYTRTYVPEYVELTFFFKNRKNLSTLRPYSSFAYSNIIILCIIALFIVIVVKWCLILSRSHGG